MSQEIPYTNRVCNGLKQFGTEIIPYSASRRNMSGVPDRIMVHRDFMLFVEFKGWNTPLKNNQALRILRLNRDRENLAAVIIRQAYKDASFAGTVEVPVSIDTVKSAGMFGEIRELLNVLKRL